MQDSFFSKSVVLLLAHSEQGAAGLVLNRVTEATVSDLSQSIFQQEFEWDKSIRLGGPVAGPLMILHRDSDLADHEVCPGIYSTVEDIKVRQAIRDRLSPCIIAINYAGWGPGQLENEMAEDAWEVISATEDLVFGVEVNDIWNVALQTARSQKLITLLNLRDLPGDPTWN